MKVILKLKGVHKPTYLIITDTTTGHTIYKSEATPVNARALDSLAEMYKFRRESYVELPLVQPTDWVDN